MSDKQPFEGRTFWVLKENVGIEPDYLHETDREGAPKKHPHAGAPGPLVHTIITIPFPNMVAGNVEIEHREAHIRPSEQTADDDWRDAKLAENGSLSCARIIPGSRTIETTAPPIAEYLDSHPLYEETDAPRAEQPHKPKKTEVAS